MDQNPSNHKSKKGRTLELLLLGFLFFSPRIIFLYWLTHNSTAYQEQSISSREPSPTNVGDWARLAQDLAKGKPDISSSDDLGVPILMAGFIRAGVPLRETFYLSSLLILGIAFVFFYSLYKYLQSRLEGRALNIIFIYLALYPPGVYFSFSLVARILPVYAFLASLVILLYAQKLFRSLSLSRFFLYLGFSIYGNFLILARNTNKPIFLALLAAVLLKLLFEKINLKPYTIFAVLFISGYFVFHSLAPKMEHTIWHPIYLGLGEFDNKYHIETRDQFAKTKAQEFDPSLKPFGENVDLNPNYEITVKKMALELITKDPLWYGRILFLRSLKIVFIPFQGSWLMSMGESQQKESIQFGELTNGFNFASERCRIVLGSLTAVLDLTLTLLGGIILGFVVIKSSWKVVLPYFFLISATTLIYILVISSNRTVFLAGTYFYQFFAILFLSQLFCGLTPEFDSLKSRVNLQISEFFKLFKFH